MKKIDFQKVFCIISACFLLTCIAVYGYRFISLYIENNSNKINNETGKNADNTISYLNNEYEWSNLWEVEETGIEKKDLEN